MLVLTACTSSEEVVTQDNGGQAVNLTASTRSTAVTRAADGLYTASTGFDGGETLVVFMKSEAYGIRQADYAVGTPDAANGYSSLLSPAGTDKLLYPTGSVGSVTLYGVYPSTSAMSHSVVYDQTTEAGYKASDLMYARTEVALTDKQQPQTLSFGHQLVKMHFTVSKGIGVDGIAKVEMLNVKRQATVTVTDTELSLSELTTATGSDAAEGDNILVFGAITDTDPHESVVLFPKQAWDNTAFLKVTASNGETAVYLLSKSDWTVGAEYPMTINVDAAALSATSVITDWSPQGAIVSRPYNEFYVEPIADQTYTGSALEPTPVVTFNSTTPLTLGEDYKLLYSNNIEVGTATITIIGINNYTGKTATASFNIVAH